MNLSHTHKRTIVVDTDLRRGGDDSLALALLLQDPNVQFAGITTVSGNSWVDVVTKDTGDFLQNVGRSEISIYPGLRSRDYRPPLAEPPDRMVGGSFMGALRPERIEESIGDGGRSPGTSGGTSDAEVFLGSALTDTAMPFDLLAFGPLSNVAAALEQGRNNVTAVRRIFTLGGSSEPGMGEFNYWFDPTAAQKVLDSGVPVYLLPANVVDGIRISMKTLDVGTRTALADFVHGLVTTRRARSGEASLPAWDVALAGAYATQLDSIRRRSVGVAVRLSGELQIEERADSSVTLLEAMDEEVLGEWIARMLHQG